MALYWMKISQHFSTISANFVQQWKAKQPSFSSCHEPPIGLLLNGTEILNMVNLEIGQIRDKFKYLTIFAELLKFRNEKKYKFWLCA